MNKLMLCPTDANIWFENDQKLRITSLILHLIDIRFALCLLVVFL